MKLVRYSPFMEPFEEMEKQMQGFAPALDVYEDKDNIIIEAPLPKIDPERIDINIEENVLSISGASEKKTEVDDKNYYRKEVRVGSFNRTVALPASVEGDQAKAEYEDGILKITVPKSEKAKPKKIKVVVRKSK